MNSATSAYWMPVTLKEVDRRPSSYEGFGNNNPEELDAWFNQALDMFTDIYGTVVDAYHIVSEVRTNENSNYDFIINIVVTGLVDSEADFEDNILDHWPTDIVEQLKVASDEFVLANVVGYDYNPIMNNPEWEQYDQPSLRWKDTTTTQKK